MKKLLAAVLLALAQTVSGQEVVVGGRLEYRDAVPVERLTVDADFLRIATQDGKMALMSIEIDGSVTLRHAATFGFSSLMVTGSAGPLRGYVIIRVGEEYLLMPVFALPKSSAAVETP